MMQYKTQKHVVYHIIHTIMYKGEAALKYNYDH